MLRTLLRLLFGRRTPQPYVAPAAAGRAGVARLYGYAIDGDDGYQILARPAMARLALHNAPAPHPLA